MGSMPSLAMRCAGSSTSHSISDINCRVELSSPGLPALQVPSEGACLTFVVDAAAERQITFTENPAAFDDEAAAASGLYQTHMFTFDHVYDITCNQRKVYETTAKAVVDSSLQGYNATIFAYGQTVRACS